MKKYNVVLNIFVIIVIALSLFVGIKDLTNKKNTHKVEISMATEILSIENTIGYIIPVGQEHYYIALEKETNNAYIIKASNKWYKKNFDENGIPKSSYTVKVTALKKQEGSFEVREELFERMNRLENIDFVYSNGDILDSLYKSNAIMAIIAGLIPIFAFIAYKVISRNNIVLGLGARKVVLVLFILYLLLALKVINNIA